MSERACRCGLVAAGPSELTDHLFEMFLPADDMGTDGRAHAEQFPPGADGSLWVCLCGFTTIKLVAFDAHLLTVFTPADRIGRDGQAHDGENSGISGGCGPLHLLVSGVDPAITGESSEERVFARPARPLVEPGGFGPS
jgi:hypothetical protein